MAEEKLSKRLKRRKEFPLGKQRKDLQHQELVQQQKKIRRLLRMRI